VLEPVHVFWVLVGILAVAAGWNHGWHHVRHDHLVTRLTRAARRDGASGFLEKYDRD
jgi:hypothetical protein